MVSIHNGTVRAQNKAGGTVYTVTLDFFWSSVRAGARGYTFDPRFLHYPNWGRWIVTACDDLELPGSSGVLVGVSQSNDPTGNWNLYKVTIRVVDPTNPFQVLPLWADYPSIGFNDRWIVVQVNLINGHDFDRSGIFVFEKTNLIDGDVGNFTAFFRTGIGGTQVPAIGSSSTGAMYLLQNWNGNSAGQGYLRIYTIQWFPVLGDPRGRILVTPGPFVSIPDVWDSSAPTADLGAQLGSTARIDLGDAALWKKHGSTGPTGGQRLRWWPARSQPRRVRRPRFPPRRRPAAGSAMGVGSAPGVRR